MSVNKSLVITGLVNDKAYSVKIKAVHPDSFEEISNTVSAAPKALYDAPEIVSIVPGDRQLVVNFLAPPFNRVGLPLITNYQFSIDGGSSWSSVSPESITSPIYITGLVNGQTYYVKIRGSTDQIPSSLTQVTAVQATPSNIPMPTTPSSPSIASVQLPAAISGSTSISARVFFAPPSVFGNTPITSYEYSLNSDAYVTIPSTSTYFDLPDLVVGQYYNVAIRACNTIGCGLNSISTTFVAASIPAAPVITSKTVVDENLYIAYTVYSPDMEVTNIKYSINNGPFITRTPVSKFSPLVIPATELTNPAYPTPEGISPATHTLRLMAVGTIADGESSNNELLYYASKPAAPKLTSYTVTYTETIPQVYSLHVNYSAVSPANAPIQYVYYSIDDGVTWSSAINYNNNSTTITISSGLSEKQTYKVKLRVTNATTISGNAVGGLSPDSTALSCFIASVPSAPIAKILDPTEGIRVQLQKPLYTSGYKISKYQYSIDGKSTWIDAGTSDYFVIPVTDHIGPTQTFLLNFRAFSDIGAGNPLASDIVLSGVGLPYPIDILYTSFYTTTSIPGGGANLRIFVGPQTRTDILHRFAYSINDAAFKTIKPVGAVGTEYLWFDVPITTTIDPTQPYKITMRSTNSYGTGPVSDARMLDTILLDQPKSQAQTPSENPPWDLLSSDMAYDFKKPTGAWNTFITTCSAFPGITGTGILIRVTPGTLVTELEMKIYDSSNNTLMGSKLQGSGEFLFTPADLGVAQIDVASKIYRIDITPKIGIYRLQNHTVSKTLPCPLQRLYPPIFDTGFTGQSTYYEGGPYFSLIRFKLLLNPDFRKPLNDPTRIYLHLGSDTDTQGILAATIYDTDFVNGEFCRFMPYEFVEEETVTFTAVNSVGYTKLSFTGSPDLGASPPFNFQLATWYSY